MFTMRQSLEIFIIILLGTALSFFVTVQRNNTSGRSLFSRAAAPIAQIPVPTEMPAGPQEFVMDSPEGSRTLTLEKNGSTYSLFTSDKAGGQKIQVFQKEEPTSQSLEIPFNTWSTDNKYIFLKETLPEINNYLVFQSSGNLFANDKASVSVQEVFNAKVPNYTIEDVTGWAGNTSLIVNAKSVEGDKKVSFWFEVPSQSFIPLGTYFK